MLWRFDYQVLAFGLPCIFIWIWEIFFRKNQTGIKQILWSLFAIGYGLTFVVEVLVLKGDVGRANMVFRMYNLAWFILGITMSIVFMEIIKLLKSKPKIVKVTWFTVFIILLLSGLLYPILATNKKMIDRWPNVDNPPKTLDGALFMLGNPTSSGEYTPALYTENNIEFDLSLDYDAIKFMQDNVIGSPVIVEGHTSEYRWGARCSIHTGLPSVIGWNWHTRQHNSLLDRAVVDKRIDDVNNFYNTVDIDEAIKFIEKYRVEYIIVSGLERAVYKSSGLEKFNMMVEQEILEVVYGTQTNDSATIYQVIK